MNSEVIETVAIAPLELRVSDEMISASMALCSLKYFMDTQSRSYLGQPFINDWMEESRGTCAYMGHSFLRHIVPFLDWDEQKNNPFKALVNPLTVLGACIKGFPRHIKSDKVEEAVRRYSQEPGSRDDVLYIWYRPLGILVAHEGKHRVAFMREHQQPAIAAWIEEASYPCHERLKLIIPTGEDYWLALLDNRYLQVIERPCTTRAYMRAYGVKEVRWSELNDFPDESEARRRLEVVLIRSRDSIREADRTLDIEEMRNIIKEESATELVKVNLLDIQPYRFEWHIFLRDVGLLILLSLVVLSTSIPYSETIGVGLIGVATGMVMMGANKRIIAIRRRNQGRRKNYGRYGTL